jgi:anti-sigma B factor antagonist
MTGLLIERQLDSHRALRLTVTGDLDLSTSPQLDAELRKAIASGHVAHLHVDLAQVDFLDSTGINVLVAGHKLATGHGMTYIVTNPHGMVRRALDVIGVLQLLTGQPDPDGSR